MSTTPNKSATQEEHTEKDYNELLRRLDAVRKEMPKLKKDITSNPLYQEILDAQPNLTPEFQAVRERADAINRALEKASDYTPAKPTATRPR